MRRIRGRLNPSEQEWRRMAPPLQDVVTLSGYMEPGSPMARQAAASEQQAPRAFQEYEGLQQMVETRMRLRKALSQGGGSSEGLERMVRKLRQAREQARSRLREAQEELRRELTARQEARLMLMGVLE